MLYASLVVHGPAGGLPRVLGHSPAAVTQLMPSRPRRKGVGAQVKLGGAHNDAACCTKLEAHLCLFWRDGAPA